MDSIISKKRGKKMNKQDQNYTQFFGDVDEHHGLQDVIIYARVSSKQQVSNGNGIESQITKCKYYADYQNYNIIKIFSDDITGKNRNRNGIDEMFKFLKSEKKQGNHYVILIDDISRWARDIRTHFDLRDALSEMGHVLESPNMKFKDDPESLHFEGMQALNAQYQRLKNAKQTKHRMTARMLNGYYCFAAPIGYKYKKEKGNGKILVKNEPLASIIAEALEGFASNRFRTHAEVARFLESQPEYPKDKYNMVKIQRVVELFDRKLYAGYIDVPKWNLENIKAKHDALISFETYQKIQEKLKTKKKPQIIARKDYSADFPLRGAVVCGDCGSPLTAAWSQGKSKKYAYYFCHNRKCSSYRTNIKKDVIESQFEHIVENLKPSKSLFKTTIAMLEDIWNFRLNQSKQRQKELASEVTEIQKQIDSLLKRIIQSDNDSVIKAYETKVSELEGKKIIAQENLAKNNQKSGKKKHSFRKLFEHSFKLLANPQSFWYSGNIEHKKMLLKLAFSAPPT